MPPRTDWTTRERAFTLIRKSQSLTFSRNAPADRRPKPAMTARQEQLELPQDAIVVRKYGDLFRYLRKFAAGELGLMLLLGRHGTGKTENVRTSLRIGAMTDASSNDSERPLYVEGHARPFGLYQQLWRHRDQPVVLDDLDKLYANADCVRIPGGRNPSLRAARGRRRCRPARTPRLSGPAD